MVIHLLRKWTALYSRNSTSFTHNFIMLITEIIESLELQQHQYLQSMVEDSNLFENTFKSVFKPFISKGDIKDPIVNDFWVQSLSYGSALGTNPFLKHSASSSSLSKDFLASNAISSTTTTPHTAVPNLSSLILEDEDLPANSTPIQKEIDKNQPSQPQPLSRYQTDFEELEVLGMGGFGKVTKCRHRLDGRYYAVKRIPIQQRGEELQTVLREVATLSRMQGPYILRYYSAWFESGGADKSVADILNFHTHSATIQNATRNLSNQWMQKQTLEQRSGYYLPNMFGMQQEVDPTQLSNTLMSLVHSSKAKKGKDDSWFADSQNKKDNEETEAEPELYLYMVTGYCEQTLRDVMMDPVYRSDPMTIWRTFRQILEGLAFIHEHGIIHRDLKPTNVFVDSRGEVRIGDFGLATFNPRAALESSSSTLPRVTSYNLLPEQTTGIGTYLYISPEQLGALKKSSRTDTEKNLDEASAENTVTYDAKVDMYSLGIILFEMWHPFSTLHERMEILQEVKEGRFPAGFEQCHPRQAQIIRQLLKKSPKERPTAMELLHSDLLPPKMENEYLKDVLRTVSNPDSHFYGHVLGVMFQSAHRLKSLPKLSALPHQSTLFPLESSNSLLVSSDVDILKIAIREMIVMKVKRIFSKHCALPLDNSYLQPFRNVKKLKVDWTDQKRARSNNDVSLVGNNSDINLLFSPLKHNTSNTSSSHNFNPTSTVNNGIANNSTALTSGGTGSGAGKSTSNLTLTNNNTSAANSTVNSSGIPELVNASDDWEAVLDRYTFMDSKGEVTSLRRNLRVPLAAMLSKEQIHELKSYTIAPVFQSLEAGNHLYPNAMLQADMDIIDTTAFVMADAEILYVCTEVLSLLNTGGYQIRVGDTELTRLMLEECGINDELQQYKVWRILFEAHLTQPLTSNLWESSIKSKLKHECQLSNSKLKKLAMFLFHNNSFSPSNMASLKSLFSKQKTKDLDATPNKAHQICDRLKQISKYLQLWDVPQHYLFFDFTILLDDIYKGFVFRALYQKNPHAIPQWVASGGRYDRLLKQFVRMQRRHENSSFRQMAESTLLAPRTNAHIDDGELEENFSWTRSSHGRDEMAETDATKAKKENLKAVGLSIDLERMIEWRYEAENTESYQPNVRLKQIPWVNQALNRTAYVFVCTQGDSIYLEKALVQLIGLLWKIQVPCEYLYSENPALSVQLERASKKYALWIATIKEKDFVKIPTSDNNHSVGNGINSINSNSSNSTTTMSGHSGSSGNTTNGSFVWTLEKIRFKNVRQKSEIDLKWEDIPKFFAKSKR